MRASLATAPFLGEQRDDCWNILHRLAAGSRPNTIDLVHLRGIVARARPPVELCCPDLGTQGPILGTVHASKGREADTVVLVMPSPNERNHDSHDADSALLFEEGRVYYVGATRARKMLIAAGNNSTRVGYLDSKRVYRSFGQMRAQLEVGRDGDVDGAAHLAWSSCLKVQRCLASCAGRVVSVKARALAENSYSLRLVMEQKDPDGITRPIEVGQMSESFRRDLGKLWSRMDSAGDLRPSGTIPHLYLIAVTTVGLAEEDRAPVKSPFNQSGLALAPVVKGFPMIHFLFRKRGRHHR